MTAISCGNVNEIHCNGTRGDCNDALDFSPDPGVSRAITVVHSPVESRHVVTEDLDPFTQCVSHHP